MDLSMERRLLPLLPSYDVSSEPSIMIRSTLICFGIGLFAGAGTTYAAETPIPKPEHPRPDAMRANWANLNGRWEFRFDANDQGLRAGWEKPEIRGLRPHHRGPFSLGERALRHSPAKGRPVIGWYRRQFTIPKEFPASIGSGSGSGRSIGGLTSGSMAERSSSTRAGTRRSSPISPMPSSATARTSWSFARSTRPIRACRPASRSAGTRPARGSGRPSGSRRGRRATSPASTMMPAIDPARVGFHVDAAGLAEARRVRGRASRPAISSDGPEFEPTSRGRRPSASRTHTVRVHVAGPRPQALDSGNAAPLRRDPRTSATRNGKVIDSIQTYFGLRTIGRGKYGDEPFERILLNGKPIYLRAALDQSFNPKGIYTAPDDEFLKRDMEITKAMGLNGLRIHIKPDEPRRLYWADRYRRLDPGGHAEHLAAKCPGAQAWEQTMREAIARDRNHPVDHRLGRLQRDLGAGASPEEYKKDRDTQKWVGEMVQAIRELDPTRLVEDNSPCNYDHVVNTDLNSWHFYIDDHERGAASTSRTWSTKPSRAADFNYCPGLAQSSLPLINSEYGAVSAGGGDRDISWGLRDLTTQLRRHPKIQGFIYTELSRHRVGAQRAGQLRPDSQVFGYDTWVPDMRPNELLGADFIGYDAPPAIVGKPGETITVPIFVSHFSDRQVPPKLRWWVSGYDSRGDIRMVVRAEEHSHHMEALRCRRAGAAQGHAAGLSVGRCSRLDAPRRARHNESRRISSIWWSGRIRPCRGSVGAVSTKSWFGSPRATSPTSNGPSPPRRRLARSTVMARVISSTDLELPPSVVKAHPESILLSVPGVFQGQARAGRLARAGQPAGLSSDGRDPSLALDADPVVQRSPVDRIELPDDAADARGVLSHLAGVEHGSHGELVDGLITLTDADRAGLEAGEPLILRFAVPNDATHAGGLCLFGADTGELPLDPTLEIRTRDPLPTDLGVDLNAKIAVPAGP